MSVLLDIQGIQSRSHSDRGIARYLLQSAMALEALPSCHVSSYVLNPDLPVRGALEPLVATGRVSYQDRLDPRDATVYHAGSPFEDVSLDRVWPPFAREARLRLVVTLYDVIPLLYWEDYLADPAVRARYRTRLHLLRMADRILTISQSSARDAVEVVGLQEERVQVVGAGVSDGLVPPSSREEAYDAARRHLPWLEPGFVMYTGGIDPRKNVGRLLSAYAGLPDQTRRRHQLVIVCHVEDADRAALEADFRHLRISQRVRLTGFVPDELLALLYQACELFVFPSLYEGFGLPVAEAQACGAPVIVGRTSSLLELVSEPRALFDPNDVREIRAALHASLDDADFRASLRRQPDPNLSWSRVAERIDGVYQELICAPRRARGKRPRIALVSPLPPQQSGVAYYADRLLHELSRSCHITAFVDVDPENVESPRDVQVHSISAFDDVERAAGGFDNVLYLLGNSPFHVEALRLLRKRPGVVVAHDVRLTWLYQHCSAERPDIERRDFAELLRMQYGACLPADAASSDGLSPFEQDRLGIFMAQDAIAASEQFLVHSEYAAQIARLEAPRGMEGKVHIIPFAAPPPREGMGRFSTTEAPIVGTFGIVSPAKQSEKVLNAMPTVLARHPRAKLAVVGPIGVSDRHRLHRTAEQVGVRSADFTGAVDEETFATWLDRTLVAVQLRAFSNGETSASVYDCLAAGLPTVVTAIGSNRELPDDCVVKVDREISAPALGSIIADLIDDENRRMAISEAALKFARAHSFRRAADALRRAMQLNPSQA